MKNPRKIFQEISWKSIIFADFPSKLTAKHYKNSGTHEFGPPKHYKNSGTHEVGLPKHYKNSGTHDSAAIFLEPKSCVPPFSRARIVRTTIFLDKNSGTHDDGYSIVWSPFWPPISIAEVGFGSRKQVVLGPLFFSIFWKFEAPFLTALHFWARRPFQ